MDWDRQFSVFVREHADGLFRSAWLLVGDRASAADLVQEAFTVLYPKWDRVLAAQAPLAYVRRTMVNQFLSQARRKASLEIVLADVPDQAVPDPRLDTALDRHQLMPALAGLSPRQRAAITLHYFDDLPDREAAHLMGCPVITFRSHLRRGLAHLRTDLDPDAPSRPQPGQRQRSAQ
jgi:RNA polymerase sigma-70 factor (sigma-E family)